MAPNTAKRVVAYRFERQPVEGFFNPSTFFVQTGVELLTLAGALQTLSYAELKAICFGGEPARFDLFESHPVFERRPRFPGLWTRFTLRDGDQIEGILPHNLVEWPSTGFLFMPPRPSGVRQRVFLPREAVKNTELLGVIGVAASRTRPAKRLPEGQLQMFE